MTDPRRDPADTAERLRKWLEQVQGLRDVTIGEIAVPTATGFSNETILFDARWSAPDGSTEVHELVARIAPSGHRVFPDDTFVAQFQVMRELAAHSDVPMAGMRWLERDTGWFGQPFWIMDRVRGDIPTDNPPYAAQGWLAEATPAEQERAWMNGVDAMARVHATALGALTLPPELPVPATASIEPELERLERFLHWAEEGERHAAVRRALAWLDANRPAPPAGGPALVWGDARLANLVYRDGRVVAVLDWEMATVGDPLLDLGWWIFADEAVTVGAGLERLPGFASRDETAARWRSATGRSSADLHYFVVLAGVRFSVIVLRVVKLFADLGLFPASFAYDNHITAALERELARA